MAVLTGSADDQLATADEALAFYAFDPRLAGMTFDTLPRIAEALFGPFWQARIDRARHARPGATALEVLSDAQTGKIVLMIDAT